MKLRFCLALLLFVGSLAPGPECEAGEARVDPNAAATRVAAAARAQDEAALKRLARADDPDPWLVAEVLDDKLIAVYSQDELRFIGDHQFTPGKLDNYSKTFAMDKTTGYYYFRFTAVNGTYEANPMDEPVVSFCIRQGVISGWALWGPVVAGLLMGLLLLLQAVRLIWAFGVSSSDDEEFGVGKGRRHLSGHPVEPTNRFEPSGR